MVSSFAPWQHEVVLGVDQRSALRQHLRATRRGLTGIEQRRAASAVARRVDSFVGPGSGIVGSYLCDDGELDAGPAIQRLVERGWAVALPTFDRPDSSMRFARHRAGEPLVSGPLGIRQPSPASLDVDPKDLDVVLLPAVGVDRFGTRVGRGGGHYDRMFASRLEWSRSPTLIAVTHDVQVVGAIARQTWDVPVDLIVTPTRLIVVGQA